MNYLNNKCNSKHCSAQFNKCKHLQFEHLDESTKKPENRRTHKKKLISKYEKLAIDDSNSSRVEKKNKKAHKTPELKNEVGIFWDLHGNKLNTKNSAEMGKFLMSRFRNSTNIKVYGEKYIRLFAQLKSTDYEFRFEAGISDLNLLVSDIEKSSNSLKKIVIISLRAPTFISEIINLKLKNDVSVITSPKDLNEVAANVVFLNSEICKGKDCAKTSDDLQGNHIEKSFQVSMIKYLKHLAYEGKLGHEISELKRGLVFHLNIPINYVQELIKIGCESGKIFKKLKKFGKYEMHLVSLKVQTLSPKVLLWVLRSLKRDEMISTEKAIQSRLKEAFEMRVEQAELADFIASSVSQADSLSAGTENFSLFSSQNKRNKKNLFFNKKLVKNYGSSTENLVIYPENEEWVSYDQYTKQGDVLLIKNTLDWKAFLDFFKKFYSDGYTEEKALFGGKYSCALYLKYFCSSLKETSIGRLNYIVQLAVDEDILRYHKSLLVLSAEFDKKCKENKRNLLDLKRKIVQLIADSNEGISLAQIPGLLEEKNISEQYISSLGYAKIKDLIEEIPDLEIAFLSRNHPFVKLKVFGKAKFSEILKVILTEVELLGGAVPVDDIEMKISEIFGYGFLWTSVGVKNFEGFLKKYADDVVYERKMVCKRDENLYSCANSTNCDDVNQQNELDFLDEC